MHRILWIFAIVFAVSILNETAKAKEFSLGFTIPSGSVLSSSGKVMPAEETESGKRSLEQDGFLVSGGFVFVDVKGHTAKVNIKDLQGKSKPQIKDYMKTEIINQVGSKLVDSAISAADKASQLEASAEMAEQLANEGLNVVDTVEEALNSGGIDTAVDTANEAVAAAVEQAAHDFVHDPNGVNAGAIADGHTPYTGDPSGAPGAGQ